ncbi:FG-GAP-like repeat-containing protein [Streptomyces albidoflavus]
MWRYRQRPRTRAGAGAVLSTALAVALLTQLTGEGTAFADDGSSTPAAAKDAPVDPTGQALELAQESGEPVEVLAERTETAQVFANPSGTLTQDTYALPQWVRQDGTLREIDTTLAKNTDGTLSPKATEVEVRFSGGGDGPLVSVRRDGRGLHWTWPGELPTPRVENDAVTYPDVLPDVDLRLRAGSAGFGQILVVKSAEAAASPALETIKFGLEGDGLEVEADEHGNLTAVNPAGQEIFTAPTPLMWDSSSSSGRATARGTQGPESPPADEFTPPHGAREATMGVALDGPNLSLIPDREILLGEDTQYPVYLDPSVSGSRYAWAIAYKKTPNSSYYNGNGWRNSDGSVGTKDARVGYEDVTNGLARSYFRMNTKNLWSTDKVVGKSTFRIKNTWSYSCTAKPVQLWRTAAIGSSVSWNNRPTRREMLDSVTAAKGWSGSCPAGNLAFDVTKGAKDAAASQWNTITFELAAGNESDVLGWKRFEAKSAVFSTEYNTRPGVPTGLDTSPSTAGDGKICRTTAPFGLIGNTPISLRAKATDKDADTVRITFHLWATGHHPNDDPNGKLIVDKTVSAPSGQYARYTLPTGLLKNHIKTAGGNFSWKAQAGDGKLTSDWNPTKGAPGCRFVHDPDRPDARPGISSTKFPNGASGWPSGTGSVREEGVFQLTNGGVSDVVSYEYWTDSDKTVRTVKAGTDGKASVRVTPTITGANLFYARSLDKAGNPSDLADYLFYAFGPAQPDQPGDIDGDGNPDLWSIDKDGALQRHHGAGDGTLMTSTKTASNATWDDTLITHRGDWTGDGYEDLVALRPDATTDSQRLWLHPNNGFGFACSNCTDGVTREELTVYSPENDHWQNADQILAIGDVDGPLDVDGDGIPDVPGHPDLLVKEGDRLWLYFGHADRRLDSDLEPVLLASEGWADMDLIAPGDTDGDGRPDLAARDRANGDLWVYRGTDEHGDWLTDVANKVQAGSSFTVAANPLITSPGDADHSGHFDLWYTRSSTNTLHAYLDVGTDAKRKLDLPGDWTGHKAIS